jgi:predicted ATP-dependent protease
MDISNQINSVLDGTDRKEKYKLHGLIHKQKRAVSKENAKKRAEKERIKEWAKYGATTLEEYIKAKQQCETKMEEDNQEKEQTVKKEVSKMYKVKREDILQELDKGILLGFVFYIPDIEYDESNKNELIGGYFNITIPFNEIGQYREYHIDNETEMQRIYTIVKKKLRKNIISNTKRFQVLKRDNFKCQYCGKTAKETRLEVDHIIPKSKGGSDELDNLITSCIECNRGKRDKSL